MRNLGAVLAVQTNLYKLAKEIVEERKLQEAGAGEPQIRQEPRWLADARIPGPQLRPWAHKMQLRPAEEAALELVRALAAAVQLHHADCMSGCQAN